MSAPTGPVPNAPPMHSAEAWNQRFSADTYLFGTEPNTWLTQQHAVLAPGQRALCVSDGEGRNSVWLARQGLLVDAFDVSDVGAAKARKLAEQAQVQVNYAVADCDAWPWPVDAYDAVLAIFVQYAAPDMRARLFANMVRALKPGGVLCLLGYTPKQLEYKTGGPSVLSHLYTAELLRDAFAGLSILALNEFEDDLTEGAQHSGRSAMVGLVARKPRT